MADEVIKVHGESIDDDFFVSLRWIGCSSARKMQILRRFILSCYLFALSLPGE